MLVRETISQVRTGKKSLFYDVSVIISNVDWFMFIDGARLIWLILLLINFYQTLHDFELWMPLLACWWFWYKYFFPRTFFHVATRIHIIREKIFYKWNVLNEMQSTNLKLFYAVPFLRKVFKITVFWKMRASPDKNYFM